MNTRQTISTMNQIDSITIELRTLAGGLPTSEGVRCMRLLNIAEQLETQRIEIANTKPAT
ncbi:MAG: hypothetical protein R8K20_07000 [Gallionellaceae bacterium]